MTDPIRFKLGLAGGLVTDAEGDWITYRTHVAAIARLTYVDELREAAGKVTCERCGGSTCAPEHGRGIPAPGTCPDCADLRRLLEEKP